MPHRSHFRRHRAITPAQYWLPRLVLGSCALVGAFSLGVFFAQSPWHAALIAGSVTVPAVIALVALGCFSGWLLARLRNGFSFLEAHYDLGRFMQKNASFRAARRSIVRHDD
ncbi:MAG: hypothetical protein V4773_23420 [Verrucomicrobiota bacterium]